MSKTISKEKKAQEIWKNITELENFRDGVYFTEAKWWSELKNEGLYKFVFGDNGDLGWRSFLAEANQKPSTVDQKILNYDTWIKKFGVKPEKLAKIHVNKLFFAIKYANKDNVDDILSKAKNLSFSDFRAELTGEEPVCDHKDIKEVRKCAKCKKEV